ncbi:YqzK family protein [Bacillus atrophaeus]|uniref:YqzK family protein n=1 Tax=Bacillus atrophaeus TaxID=1452 RepID=UPI00240D414A|nr:YqzK family protein [Bacillus atrophaeus]
MSRFFKAAADTVKVFILFTGFTALFYYAMIWVNSEYENYHRYDKPEGSAVKVIGMENKETDGWLGRLMFFYQNGE